MNGKKLWLKAIISFQIETPITIYHMLNSGHQKKITAELTKILESACDSEEELEYTYQHGGATIPEFTFRLNVPKIPGQDTSVFQSWPRKLQCYQKVIHLECDAKDSKIIQDLVAVALKGGTCSNLIGEEM